MSVSRHVRWIVFLLMLPLLAVTARAAEVIPPSPRPDYIVDTTGKLSKPVIQAINQQLLQVERDTSNQIVVGVYPTMQSSDDLAAYAVRVYQAWKVGQKGKNNGVLLLVFVDDHKMRIETGYGLEGALPDATCKQIMDNEISPRLKAGDYDGGIQAGVNAILAATRGEYKGNGSTNLNTIGVSGGIFLAFFVLIIALSIGRGIFGTGYYSGGRIPWWAIFLFNAGSSGGRGWSGGGGGWSGGGGGGGGGGFSGGGGSTGGGGASGSW